MPLVDIICLANSNKMGGRCVAGLRLNGQGWVRPIAPDTDHGQLYARHFRLEGGEGEPLVLDVVRIDLAKPSPSPGQPENWIIGERRWALIERPAGPKAQAIVRASLVRGPSLLGSSEKRIGASLALRAPASLAATHPSKLQFFVQRDLYDRLQPRVLFDLDGKAYNLPITDPGWTSRIVRKLMNLDPVNYPSDIVGISKDEEVVFTVSLSEPFQSYCYKLVAGIVVMQ
jgi:putative nucleic acid modification protein with dual OB domain